MKSRIIEDKIGDKPIQFPIAMKYIGEEDFRNGEKTLIVLFTSNSEGFNILLENVNTATPIFKERKWLVDICESDYWIPFRGKIEIEFP